MVSRAIACGLLLSPSCIYGQDKPLERPASDFDSKGVGLTETLLKFSHQQRLRIAIEYVDRESLEQPIDVNLQNKTVRQGLDTILRIGHGYSWRLRNGIVEIANRRGSKRADKQLNMVIPMFTIGDGDTAIMASVTLWWNLQMKLDPELKGYGGDIIMAQRLPQSNQPYCITKLFGKFSVTSFLIVALKAGLLPDLRSALASLRIVVCGSSLRPCHLRLHTSFCCVVSAKTFE